MNSKASFNSRHFRLEQLADGVYAAINKEEGWAICNAGIIDLGDRTLVYDAFMTPAAAKELREAAERLTGRPVHAVINSHYHNDHIWGNQGFSAETDIIADAKTRELIVTKGAQEIRDFQDITPGRLEFLTVQIAESHDENELTNLRLYVTYYQAINTSLPILKIRLPNITFEGNLVYTGSKRSARLISVEGGHCESDVILHLPEDGIVFMEDLLFIGFHPYLADGNPKAVQKALEQVKKLNAKIFVPGHGPVGKSTDLNWMDEYIETLDAMVSKAIANGATEEAIEKLPVPETYHHLLFPAMFLPNVKFLYQEQMKAKVSG
jgi:glyoxylase-like metal-dependent hydrolase (beta-lactamase superfamily II)